MKIFIKEEKKALQTNLKCSSYKIYQISIKNLEHNFYARILNKKKIRLRCITKVQFIKKKILWNLFSILISQ
jgi:hypothetical protein